MLDCVYGVDAGEPFYSSVNKVRWASEPHQSLKGLSRIGSRANLSDVRKISLKVRETMHIHLNIG